MIPELCDGTSHCIRQVTKIILYQILNLKANSVVLD
jgi:hypothetical protein